MLRSIIVTLPKKISSTTGLILGVSISFLLLVLIGCYEPTAKNNIPVGAIPNQASRQQPGIDESKELTGLVFPLDDSNEALRAIRNEGEIRVAMRIKSGVYEPYTDGSGSASAATGFHYNLVYVLAELLDVKLRITVVDSISEYFEGENVDLSTNTRLPLDVDLYADIITILPDREELVRFIPIIPVRQLVITRHDAAITSLSELERRTISMVRGSSYETQLAWHSKELDIDPQIHYVLHTSDMVRAVADGEADVTLQDSVLGFSIIRDFPNLRLGRPVGEAQFLGWAVARENESMYELIKDYVNYVREAGIWEEFWIDESGIGYLDYLALIGI